MKRNLSVLCTVSCVWPHMRTTTTERRTLDSFQAVFSFCNIHSAIQSVNFVQSHLSSTVMLLTMFLDTMAKAAGVARKRMLAKEATANIVPS